MNSTENTECALTGSTLPENEEKHEQDTGRISGIYKIVNKENGKYYIGSSVNIKCRWRKHREALSKNIHKNRYLQQAWNKYGPDVFEFVIIENVSPSQLNNVEQWYLNNGKMEADKIYNLSFLADRIEMTHDVKMVLSNLAKRRFADKRNHPMYGKKHSSETIDKIKHTLRGMMAGSKNPKFDSKIYDFVNDNTNETFTGTRYDFCRKYDIHSSRVSAVLRKLGRSKRIRGWRIYLNVKPV